MILINFSTRLKEHLIAQAEGLLHEPIDRVVDFPLRLDCDQLIVPQFKQEMEKFPLSREELCDEPVAIVLPAVNYQAALILTELHAWLDYFPPILWVRIQPFSVPPRAEVAELFELQEIEDSTRRRNKES